ncbi:putative polyketide synthase [Mycena amicta]|nr:putative polyketide synthase [Mycena amicta]
MTDIPLFAGQGTSASSQSAFRAQALQDAASGAGSTLLAACHESFHAELSSLPPDTLRAAGIHLDDFPTPTTLLQPDDGKTRGPGNPIISGISLFLFQALRYLRVVEQDKVSVTPFRDALRRFDMGVLGFSSGILPACVVAASPDLASYIAHSVEAFRLAIWIGVRAEAYRSAAMAGAELGSALPLPLDDSHPWSIVVLGASRDETESLLRVWAQEHTSSATTKPPTPLYITAVLDGACVTVSGRPDVLEAFGRSLEPRYVVHKTTLDTLYHAPVHQEGLRVQVLADMTRRGIKFPDFDDLHVPLRSTFDGNPANSIAQSLGELVVDMILTQSVNWDCVVEKLAGTTARLLNFGPGTGLLRTTERALRVSSVDLSKAPASHATAKQEPIAIVGMAVNMPSAPNKHKLWQLLEDGINTVAEIPEHRFKVEDYNGSKYTGRQMKAHTGNFLDNVDEFDNKFFKISPREAKSMDPQQRILLHAAYEALEDAGYVPNATKSFRPESFGTYIGVATADYVQNLKDDVDVYYSTGTLRAFLSGRISFAMQLSGPSMVVDTACSSSNVALYLGARALMNGDCNAALVGGVNTISSPDMFLGLDRGHFLSPTGQCKAFDASADGYSRAEGCGLFVLKRLVDAEAEHDQILGVIRGVEVNQSGIAHSITYPHAGTQAALFRKVLDTSGIDATRVNVVEAHGTGTQAGDPNEVASLRSVLCAGGRTNGNPLHITSIKANIGHLEAASGAAGLAKLLLMLQHRAIPAQISFRTRNPLIRPLEEDGTVISQNRVEWKPAVVGTPRVAMLNNFGAAGSNTAIVLEEYIPKSVDDVNATMAFVFGLSAKTPVALEDLRLKYIDWLRSPLSVSLSLANVAYTMTARRQIYPHRLAVSASSRSELVDKLSAATVPAETQGSPSPTGQAVFVFSGQGGQYLGMGRVLYSENDIFKACVDECERVLKDAGFPGVLAIILGLQDEGSGLEALEEAEAYQAAIFVLECALARMWIGWGVKPAAVIGHSLGEYAALVTAGVLSLKDALLIVAHRVRLMVRKCAIGTTGMIAVNLAPDAVEEALRHDTVGFSDLSIACYNSPTDCVLSGPLDQLRAFKAHLDTRSSKSAILTVPFGYHSPAMDPILQDLTAVANRYILHPPNIPVVSNVLGDVVLAGDASVFTPGYFARHCAEPVQFSHGVGALLALPAFEGAKIDAFIELGPHTSCLPMLKANPAVHKDTKLLASLRKQQQHSPSTTLAASLASVFTTALADSVAWRQVFSHLPAISCVSLPTYPFAKTKFWVAFQESAPLPVEGPSADSKTSSKSGTDYAMLGQWVQYPTPENEFVAVFETPIGVLAEAIVGHSVGGMPLCPASVYIELVLAGVELSGRYLQTSHHDSHVVLRRTEFDKPLVYDNTVPRTVLTKLTLLQGHGSFSVSSRVETTGDEFVHVRGEFKYQPTLRTTTKFVQTLPVISRHIAAVSQPQGVLGRQPEVFSTRTAYEVIFSRVVDYGKPYHTMQSLTVDASGMEGVATVQLPADYDRGRFVVHPVWMDTLLHVAGFVANMQGGLNDAYICTQVGAVKVFPELVNNDKAYLVYCTNAWLEDEGVMLAESYAVQMAEPRRIVAHMKGMHFRRVRLSSLKKSLVNAAGKRVVGGGQAPQTRHDATSSPSPPPVVDIEAVVIRLIAEACDVPVSVVDTHTDLAAIGIDSMMSIEIFGALRGVFPSAGLDSQSLALCRSVADICHQVSTRLGQSASPPQTSTAHTATPRTLVEDTPLLFDPEDAPDVLQILSAVLEVGLDALSPDADFDALGLDSLTAIEALHELKSQFGLDLPSDFFLRHSTPRAVQEYFSLPKLAKIAATSLLPSTDVPSLSRISKAFQLDTIPVSIQRPNTSDRLPLFLIHDGSGLVNYYDRLSFMDREIWGIHNPRFASGQPWKELVDMAAAYVDYILGTTSGPLLLGGWSFGGVAAYEIALQLTARGVQVKGILLIDAPSPINHIPLSECLIDRVLKLDATNTRNPELTALLRKQFSMNAQMLGKYVPHATASLCPPLVLLRSSEGFHPQGTDGMSIPRWLSDRSDPQTSVAGWQSLAHCSVKILDIPGHHFEPFHPSHVAELSLRIADACEYLESV